MPLMLHCGAMAVTRPQLATVHTPKPTRTWVPLPHVALLEMVEQGLAKDGLEIADEAHGLGHEDTRMGFFSAESLSSSSTLTPVRQPWLSAGLCSSPHFPYSVPTHARIYSILWEPGNGTCSKSRVPPIFGTMTPEPGSTRSIFRTLRSSFTSTGRQA